MVVVHSPDADRRRPALPARRRRAPSDACGADRAVTTVVAPQPGTSISRDGHTAVIQAGAARNANEMVRAADDLKGPLAGSAAAA